MGIYVYMLRCADESFYVGSATGDDRAPRRVTDGIAAERQIKGWSRAKKEALIKSDWETVSRFARRRGGAPRAKSRADDRSPSS
ncbi:GIY-YIG nuclease family protein [Bradyrhizobium elkanii]|uniref:GIY-YIG nuclease family protein n=1 Tax=Bradyrhizobium elkanii TaxID=29448 RepID=UPI001BADF4A0|nr:GIY-YIG nuclease family protein [Bradyrhizobium elkanii]MBR1161013.1 GIY-YIG nuclease family protein [Bradyrhizobium elkanii]